MDVEIEPSIVVNPTQDEMKPSSRKSTPEKKIRRSSRSRTPQKKKEKNLNNELNGNNSTENVNEQVEKVNGKEVIENAKEKEANKKAETADETEVLNKSATNITEEIKESENGDPAKIETVRESANEVEKDQEKPLKNGNDDLSPTSEHTVEMDPLIIIDEADPELQFLEENSDKESGKGSPIINRCTTRRSYTRNIPTPKTPKQVEQDPDSEKSSVVDQSEEIICNVTYDLPIKPKTAATVADSPDADNVSTNVEVGSDSSRLNFSEVNNSVEYDSEYLDKLRDRGLSSRRPIRGATDYRKRVLRNAHNKSDLNLPYEQVVSGIKRKNRSISPVDGKRLRIESPGYKNFFTSPLARLRNTWKSDVPSTPELLGYKDDRESLNFNDNLDLQKIEVAERPDKKNWCTLM